MRYLILLISFLFIACTSQYKLFQSKIEGQNLFLEHFGNLEKDTPKNAVIVLYNGTFRGFGGCNDYNGTFTMNKDFIHFKLSDIGTKVCSESYKESEYFQELVKTTNLVIKGKRVLFKNRYNKTLLIFTK